MNDIKVQSAPRRAMPRVRWVLLAVLLGWALVVETLLHGQLSSIRAMDMADPDDALRLVQVHDLLAGQHWFDLTQYRIDPPGGVAMHWSRLVDIPIAVFLVLLRPLLGPAGADQVAATIVPMLTLLCAMLAAGRLSARLTGSIGPVLLGSLLWSLQLTVQTQFLPLRIDHHGWQIVALLVAANALFVADPRRGGWLAGAAVAVGLSISLELLPYAALFAGVYGLRWVRARTASAGLVGLLDALALVSLGCFAATRMGDLSNRCDAVSPVYLAVLVAAAIAVRLAVWRNPAGWQLRVGALAAVGALCGGLVVLIAPQCSHGPFAQLDPLVRSFWYDRVLEGLPVWHQLTPVTTQMVVPALLGTLGAVWMTFQNKGPDRLTERAEWAEFTLLMGGMLVIGVLVARASAAAGALAMVPMGTVLLPVIRGIGGFRRLWQRLALWPLLFVALMPGLTAAALWKVGVYGDITNQIDGDPTKKSCGMPGSISLLATLPRGAIVFTPIDLGPWVLRATDLKVVATGHHRGAASMRDVIAAYIAEPEAARALVEQHHAGWLLSCGDLPEAKNYRKAAPHGLMAALNAGHAPSWLEPVALPKAAGALRLWRVVAPGAR